MVPAERGRRGEVGGLEAMFIAPTQQEALGYARERAFRAVGEELARNRFLRCGQIGVQPSTRRIMPKSFHRAWNGFFSNARFISDWPHLTMHTQF